MFCLLFHSISTNPNHGPEIFGLLCDIGIVVFIIAEIYLEWKQRH